MGWSNCGTDSQGRPIGYGFVATCDEPGCLAKIDRGLAYACGGMHGEDNSCEKYFCPEHLKYHDFDEPGGPICAACLKGREAECWRCENCDEILVDFTRTPEEVRPYVVTEDDVWLCLPCAKDCGDDANV